MMLRPRQALLVERSLAALYLHGNTLAIGPTGSGKTIMLSAVPPYCAQLGRPATGARPVAWA
jgi:DNA replication protein DnaC